MKKLATVLVTSGIITFVFRVLNSLLTNLSEISQEIPLCSVQNNTHLWEVCKDNCPEQMQPFTQKMWNEFNEPPEDRVVSKSKRQNVIILSYPGAGSQLLGKVLNENLRVFYLPEPLHSLAYYIKYNPSIGFSLSIHLLNNLFQCDFGEHEYFVDDLSVNPLRLQSRALSSALMCSSSSSTAICHNLNATVLQKLCLQESDLTVARTTMIKSLESLSVLMEKENFILKIIHFVRNPKHALKELLSQKQLSPTEMTTKARKLCNQLFLNIKYGESKDIHWLYGNYKLVKFEDFVANTIDVIRDIYKLIKFEEDSDEVSVKISLSNTTNEKGANNELEKIILGQCSQTLKLLNYW